METEIILCSTGHQALSHDLLQGEDTYTAWAVFGQHLVNSHGQARPDPINTEHEKLFQTLVSQCPPCGPGYMTSVENRTTGIYFVVLLV